MSAGAGTVSSSQATTSEPSDMWPAHGNHWEFELGATAVRELQVSPPSVDLAM